MASSIRRSSKSVPTGGVPEKAPSAPVITRANNVEGDEETAFIRLINGASSYVTPKREVFRAKTEDGLKSRVYEVGMKDLNRLLRYCDDYGKPFFKRVNTPEGGAERAGDLSGVEEQALKVDPNAEDHSDDYNPEVDRGNRGGRSEQDDAGELDTATMRLKDSAGKPVGVKV